ncbi:MAG TPA: DNA repair protein RecO [Chitinophagales bacterium]|nr:DNA repair protein RecO [Chitinophagales bacterium]
MLYKTKGVVLHTIKFTESSIITKIYTEAFGLQSYLVNNVRSSGKSRASLFGPVNILDLEVYRRENKNLQRLREFRAAHIYKTVHSDVLKSSIALFIAEVLYKCIREEEANPEMYHFIERSLIALDESPEADNNFHLFFLLALAKHLGFSPGRNSDSKNAWFDLKEGRFVSELPEHKYLITQPHVSYLENLLSGNSPVQMKADERSFLLEKILIYYALHLHGFRKVSSHRVLHEALAESNR